MDPIHIGLLVLAAIAITLVVWLIVRKPPSKRLADQAGAREKKLGRGRRPGRKPDEKQEQPEEEEEEQEPEHEPEQESEPEPEQEPEPEPEQEPEQEPERIEKPAEAQATEKKAVPGVSKEGVRSVRKGLRATRGGFIAKLRSLFGGGKPTLDGEMAEHIEEIFITSDVGAKTAAFFIERIKTAMPAGDLADPQKVWSFVRHEASRILAQRARSGATQQSKPHSVLVLGVNGVGKTTTIGKLAARHAAAGAKVVLGAGDTFRAAAVEQLEIWGQRVGCPVVKGKEGADPSSVVFDAMRTAKDQGADVVIIDTAGRLHTKVPLMDELKKIRRVMGKAMEGAPHEVLLVLDATTGQNAIAQARTFLESLAVTGIILTKLDGTAKGGVILGIANDLDIPVRFIGVGEGVEDLREFDPEEFVAALFDDLDDSEAAA